MENRDDERPPCGCEERMKNLEQSNPELARLIRPVHEIAMKTTLAAIKAIKNASKRHR